MKRKKLTEFANFLANTRHEFHQGHTCHCVAGHAARWLLPKGQRHPVDGVPATLVRAFGLTLVQAHEIYGGPSWLNGKWGQKVAVAMLRYLVKTGRVEWARAERTVRPA